MKRNQLRRVSFSTRNKSDGDFHFQFVAHPNCQQKLVEIWHGDLRNLFKLNVLLVSLMIFGYVFILPIACVFYILTSWSPKTEKVSQRSTKRISSNETDFRFLFEVSTNSSATMHQISWPHHFLRIFHRFNNHVEFIIRRWISKTVETLVRRFSSHIKSFESIDFALSNDLQQFLFGLSDERWFFLSTGNANLDRRDDHHFRRW